MYSWGQLVQCNNWSRSHAPLVPHVFASPLHPTKAHSPTTRPARSRLHEGSLLHIAVAPAAIPLALLLCTIASGKSAHAPEAFLMKRIAALPFFSSSRVPWRVGDREGAASNMVVEPRWLSDSLL